MPLDPPGGTPVHVDDKTVAMAAIKAGFQVADLPTAVAVSFSENTSRNPQKISAPNADRSRDYGLWQINSAAHADLFNAHPNWWDPQENAAMALAVFQGAGWNAWTEHSNGRYKTHQGEADAALKAAASDIGTGAISGATGAVSGAFDAMGAIANAVAAIAQSIFKAGAWIANPHNWVRASLVGLGGALVVGALVIVAKPAVTTPAQVVEKVVGRGN